MVNLSFCLRHKLRDAAGNTHNFAFDIMTKVYREAVYAKDARYAGNPMFPERQTSATAAGIARSPPASTSTVAELGKIQKGDQTGASTSASSEMPRSQRRSGVQVDILNLYRDMLRALQRLEDPRTRKDLRKFIRSEFDSNRDIPRRCITRIEWHLHHGKNKLEELRTMRPDTKFFLVK
ncbi:hypothetical protein BCY84_18823 [Trypanosoma cruzi cruzi]|uniref:LYR motif-containing protein 2 n=1 Tax=Trypanosoma cruzi TaxID=5693 RepID=A0A2V2VZ44_TRYCR|nr:putative Complex 1 protein (LYR family) [Trypanosoma cruzi]PBJ70377.1 hypothetical protein BCY84_18823 [Trypanosoma cruzi cruzi]PWV01638.1 hypothetical protein C4B63_4g257 [Trypanosoma cruzi]